MVLIELQMKKMEIKMKHFEELEKVLEEEGQSVSRMWHGSEMSASSLGFLIGTMVRISRPSCSSCSLCCLRLAIPL